MKRSMPLLALLLAGCQCDSKPDPAPAASAKAAAVGSSRRPIAKKPPVVRACHVLGVKGEATFAGKPLQNGGRVDGADFVEVADGARVTLKFDLTGRELTLIGPALARGCHHGDSVIALSRGTVETARGAGTRAGVEGNIATPAAGVTWGDANLRVTATDKETTIEVLQGAATLVRPDEQGEGQKLAPGAPPLKIATQADAAAQLEQCSKHAAQSAELAVTILRARAALRGAASAGADSFGARAAEHVRVRRLTRLRCAMAMASAGNVPPPERAGAAEKVVAADEVWRRLRR